jgi:hypothetical protein
VTKPPLQKLEPFVAPTDPARTWRLDTDGLAHAGMLADLAYVVAQKYPDVGERLFDSAQAVIDMWRACRTAAKTMTAKLRAVPTS